MPDIANAEREALNYHFNQSVFPIINKRTRELGSGFFFQRGEHHYVVSAAHVLKDLGEHSSRNYVMPARPPSQERVDMVSFGPGQLVRVQSRPRPVGEDDYFEDVAAHRILPEAAQKFREAGWLFANEQDLFVGTFSECVIFGWPATLVGREPGSTAENLAADPVVLRMNTIERPADAGKELAGEFFMSCPEAAPELFGISGSPVWVPVSQETGVWHPSNVLKLVGVQHAVGHRQAHIRATRWGVVNHMLDAMDEHLASSS